MTELPMWTSAADTGCDPDRIVVGGDVDVVLVADGFVQAADADAGSELRAEDDGSVRWCGEVRARCGDVAVVDADGVRLTVARAPRDADRLRGTGRLVDDRHHTYDPDGRLRPAATTRLRISGLRVLPVEWTRDERTGWHRAIGHGAPLVDLSAGDSLSTDHLVVASATRS
ncbi:MAG: hypothetical protein S0880_00515 [Actinomycetota bacterium]|nr:hypothetical protein [Actinomycetota bacterium]